MKFSTKTTYGLRALIFLAKQPQGRKTSLATIAQAENISLKYLEIIFAALKKAGLITSVQGSTGGYYLARPASRITVYEVVKVLEKNLTIFHCINEQGQISCSQSCHCGVSLILPKVQAAIIKTLKNLKLKQLI